jgi:hypothetical protein
LRAIGQGYPSAAVDGERSMIAVRVRSDFAPA